MTLEEKKEAARVALKCTLAILYLGLGFHYLYEVIFPKEEEMEEEHEHVVLRLRPIDNIVQFRKHEPMMQEDDKHDA